MTLRRHPSTLLSDGDLAQMEMRFYVALDTPRLWADFGRVLEELRYYKARNAILELRNE